MLVLIMSSIICSMLTKIMPETNTTESIRHRDQSMDVLKILSMICVIHIHVIGPYDMLMISGKIPASFCIIVGMVLGDSMNIFLWYQERLYWQKINMHLEKSFIDIS